MPKVPLDENSPEWERLPDDDAGTYAPVFDLAEFLRRLEEPPEAA